MMNKETPNEVHYLLISTSPHLYLNRKNHLCYSSRKLKPTKSEIIEGNKKYLDRYVIMDMATGCVYIEYLPSGMKDAVYGFLYRAWRKKDEDFPFHGIPGTVVVPAKVDDLILIEFLRLLEVVPVKPTSGFASGVRVFGSVTEFENFSFYDAGAWETDSVNWPVSLKALNEACYSWLVKSYNFFPKGNEKASRFEKWKSGGGDVRTPDDLESFVFPLGPEMLKRIIEADSNRSPEIIRKRVVRDEAAREKAEDVFDRGMEYLDRGDARKAMKDYRGALEIDPEHVDAHVHIGNLLLHNHRPKPAEICYRKAVELGRQQLGEIRPGDGWGFIETRPFMRGLHGLGLSLGMQDRWPEALECYLELLRLNPGDNQGVRYLVGYVYHRMGDYENAEKWYRENDDRPEGAWNLVCLFYQQKRIREAVEAFISAIPVNKHVPDVILNPTWGRSGSPYISFGGRDQAEAYADFCRDLWRGGGGYYKFLQKTASDAEIKALIDQERPRMPSEIEIRRMANRVAAKIAPEKTNGSV
jgi:tetratricopeptide (TPR) repeat protein